MHKQTLFLAGLFGLSAVVLGAFGAHTIKALITADRLLIYEKGVQYQFYHTAALLACGLLMNKMENRFLKYAASCFVAGIFCFSGSLYLLATLELNHLPTALLGPITPIGGLFFIAGWILFIMGVQKLEE